MPKDLILMGAAGEKVLNQVEFFLMHLQSKFLMLITFTLLVCTLCIKEIFFKKMKESTQLIVLHTCPRALLSKKGPQKKKLVCLPGPSQHNKV